VRRTAVADYLEVHEPDALTADGARILAEGEKLQSEATTRTAAISSIEVEEPWGHDKYGEAFKKGYFSTEGSDERASDAVQKNFTELGENAVKIGDAASWAMVSYTSTDADSAADIGSVRGSAD
jgi:hypothetical protein